MATIAIFVEELTNTAVNDEAKDSDIVIALLVMGAGEDQVHDEKIPVASTVMHEDHYSDDNIHTLGLVTFHL